MEGIRKVFIREAKRTRVSPDRSAYSMENEWMLDTEGVALLKVPPATRSQDRTPCGCARNPNERCSRLILQHVLEWQPPSCSFQTHRTCAVCCDQLLLESPTRLITTSGLEPHPRRERVPVDSRRRRVYGKRVTG